MMIARKGKMNWKKPLKLLLASTLAVGLWPAVLAPQTAEAASEPAVPGGGSATKPVLWLKADDGATPIENEGNLTGWLDQTGTNTFTVKGTPTYKTNGVNFNPVVKFAGNTGNLDTGAINKLVGDTEITYADAYAVFNNPAGVIIGSSTGGVNYGPGIFSKEGGTFYAMGNGANSTYTTFNYPTGPLTQPRMANSDLGGLAHTARLDGVDQTLTRIVTFTSLKLTPVIGATLSNNNGSNYLNYNGDIAEVIIYSGSTAEDRAKIETYLAVKYGITLGNGATDYIATNGNSVWSADGTYKYNIAGIARDNAEGLLQKQSRSVNPGNQVVIGRGALAGTNKESTGDLTDGQYLIWGDNGKDLTFTKPIGTTNKNHAERVWKVQNTGTVDGVQIAIPKAAIPADATLLVGTSDFTNAAEYTFTEEVEFEGKAYLTTTATLNNEEYFTFAAPAPVAQSAKLEQVESGGNQIVLTFDQEVALTDLTGFKVKVGDEEVTIGTGGFKVDPTDAKKLILTLPAGTDVTGKTLSVAYDGKGTLKGKNGVPARSFTKDVTTSDLPTMGGTASIIGNAKYGETLTADTTGITYTPNTTGDIPTYKWNRDGVEIPGATNSTYTLTEEDIDKTITVMVTADNTHATGSVTSAETGAVAKADGPAAPNAPEEESKTATSITLTVVAGQEYSVDNGVTWQDSPTFNELTPSTDYMFVTRVKVTATQKASDASPVTTIRTDAATLPVIGGTASIIGDAKYGETLTADTTGITYTPNTTEDVPTYQWNRDGTAIPGATNSTYTLTEEDIGKTITVTVTADNTHATGNATSAATGAVAKADGPEAPSALEEESKTATSIALTAVAGQEYSNDDGLTWQDSSTFNGLTPSTDYTFVTRVKATATQKASDASPVTTIRTDAATLPVMGGTVSITGDAKYGETLTADITGITYDPSTTEDVPTYQWYRDGSAISGATASTYTLTEEDIGKAITVKVIADGTNAAGNVISAATAPVAGMDAPTAPDAPVEVSKTETSITLMAVAGQEYSMNGGLTWQDSPTFSGLTPNTDYYFVTRVKATTTQSASATSSATIVRTYASNGSGSGNNGGNNGGTTTPTTPTVPTTPVTPTKPAESGIETSVNGKNDAFVTGKTSTSGDRNITSVQVDLDKLNKVLTQGDGQKLAIHSSKDGDVKVDGLKAETVKQLADKGTSLEISNPLAIYPVPGGKMDLSGVSKQLDNAALGDIAVHIDIKRSSDALINNAKNKASVKGYELLVNPVDLDLTFSHDGKTVRSEQLNGYATKYIALPEGIDPSRITTGVIVNPDGSVFHVPTDVTKVNNRYYALINDLRSNGTYSVIWNPQDFDDVKTHWGKEDVNNIAARLDLAGNGNNTFSPDRNVTRSEFSEIVVLGLGLMSQNAPQNVFPDIPEIAWFRDAVAIANEFEIVRGYSDGKFHGNQQITREQGIAMIARAYNLIEPQAALSDDRINSLLAIYEDAASVSTWAREDVAQMIAAGIVQGNGPELLSPQSNMTRAEVTALMARLLKTTDLIDK